MLKLSIYRGRKHPACSRHPSRSLARGATLVILTSSKSYSTSTGVRQSPMRCREAAMRVIGSEPSPSFVLAAGAQSLSFAAAAPMRARHLPENPMSTARRAIQASDAGARRPSSSLCGCVIAVISFGPRSTLGFFLTPLSRRTAGAATCSRSRSRCRTCCGARPAVRRRDRRQVRRAARAERRRDPLRRRPLSDGAISTTPVHACISRPAC